MTRHRGRRSVSVGVAAIVLGACVIAAGQDSTETPTTVDAGFDSGVLGKRVLVSLTLTAPDGVRVGMTANEVTFPRNLLHFDEALPGLSAGLVGADVAATVRTDDQRADNTVVEVTVTGKKGSAIPNGVVAILAFTLAENAPPDKTVTLPNRARAMSADDPPRPIQPVSGKAGEVEMLAAPPTIISCFFYMH